MQKALTALGATLALLACAVSPSDPLDVGSQQSWNGLFQGCDSVDGVEHCAFHVNGWKFYTYQDGPTPSALLDTLYSLPINTPLRLRGSLLEVGDITASLQLSAVELGVFADPQADLRSRLQGRWMSMDDPLSEIEIMGSEIRNMYNGSFLDLEFLQLADQCPDAPPGAGPLLIITTPEDHQSPRCFGLNTVSETRLELSYMGRGNTLRYRRP